MSKDVCGTASASPTEGGIYRNIIIYVCVYIYALLAKDLGILV